MPTTKNTLVVVEPTERNDHLVQKAAASATGADSTLVVLSVMSPDEYQTRRRGVADTPELDYAYTHDKAALSSRDDALRIGREALGGDAPFEAVGMVGRVRKAVAEVAEAYDCDHVVVAGHRRRLRDVLLGVPDLATRLERTFPGHVSVYFDNVADELDTLSVPDEPIKPPKPS